MNTLDWLNGKEHSNKPPIAADAGDHGAGPEILPEKLQCLPETAGELLFKKTEDKLFTDQEGKGKQCPSETAFRESIFLEKGKNRTLPASPANTGDSPAISAHNDSSPGKREPHLLADGTLVIPFASDPQYHWWRGGQTVEMTLKELREKKAVTELRTNSPADQEF